MSSRAPRRFVAAALSVAATCMAWQPHAAHAARTGRADRARELALSGRPCPRRPLLAGRSCPSGSGATSSHVEGQIGSNDGPYAVALDRNCNIYLTDSRTFRC